MGGSYDNSTGGYYGRLWEIKTLPQAGGTALMDVQHTWDAGGNLATRQDALVGQTETFAYDTLDRLTSVTGPYSENYTYNSIGNILSKNGVSYTYGGNKPHAITSAGSTNYTYDNNGNMLTRGSQTITWDAENRPISIVFGNGNSTGNWWSTNWTMRNKLTFNTTSISSNLTSFPVLVHLTASNFVFGYAQTDGGDLRFIDADNTTVLDYEIEKWTASEAWVWVRIPQLSGNSTSKFIWTYYGNNNAANGWNATGVWDSNHKMVQHLEETDIDGGAGDIKDTTTNNNHGTTHGMDTADQVTGKVDGGFDFDGVNDYVSVPDNDVWAFGDFTISMWVKGNSWGDGWWTKAFLGQDEGGGSVNKWIFSYGGGTTLFHINDIYDEVGGVIIRGNTWTPQTGVWYHVGVTRSGSTYTFYRDGATDGSPTNTYTIPNAAAPLTIGWGEGAGGFHGMIDEVRISSTKRSSDWMKASYLSETDAMITYGATESTGNTATFVYDGDGNRVKKTENGETILYVNKYYEKNLTTGNVTSYYYSGNRLVAERESSTLRYFHQDSLSSTSLMTDSSGGSLGTIKFSPFGSARTGSVPTDIQFTGQRLDATDLYYYGARYYDPSIGRFISPDPIVQDPANPQSLNRYSYVMNNPLKYVDPTGLWWTVDAECNTVWEDDQTGEQIPDYVYYARLRDGQAGTTPPPATTPPPPASTPAPTPGTPTPTPPPPAPAPAPAQSTVPSLSIAPKQPVDTKTPEPEPPPDPATSAIATVTSTQSQREVTVGKIRGIFHFSEGDKLVAAGTIIIVATDIFVGIPLLGVAIALAISGNIPVAAGILAFEDVIVTPINIYGINLRKRGEAINSKGKR